MSFGVIAVALGASATTAAVVGTVGSAAIGAIGSNMAGRCYGAIPRCPGGADARL